MPEHQRPLKVFLCHASSDKQKVRGLYNYLRRRGIKPWFDEVDLVGGQDWQVEIPKALATSDAIIICLSRNSVDKEGYVQKEIKFALDKALEMPDGRIFLIPVRFEECEVPFNLSRFQWVDLFDDIGYTRMMKALKFRISQLASANGELPKTTDVIEQKNLVLKDEQKSIENAIRERAESEAAKKTGREKIEREVNRKALLKEIFSKFINLFKPVSPKAKSFLGITGMIGLIIVLIWGSSWALSQFSLPMSTAKTGVTVYPSSIMIPTKSPSPIPPTKAITSSSTPTITKTPTPRAITVDIFDKVALLGKITPSSEKEKFTCADISPNGEIVAINSYNGTTSSVQLWETKNFTLLKKLDTFDLHITNILFSPDGSLLAAGAQDGTLKIWMVKTGKQIQFIKDTNMSIQKIGFSNDGRKLIASTLSRIEVWEVDTGRLLSAINDTRQGIQSFVVSSNNKIAYITRQDYVSVIDWIYPVDPKHGKRSETPVPLYGTNTKYIMNYGNLDDLQNVQQVLDTGITTLFDFSRNDELLLGKNWSQILILNLTNNQAKYVSYGALAEFLPDNNGIVLSRYQNLLLFHISDSKEESIPLDHHKDSITTLAFSQNGWILISGAADSVYVWGIPRWNSTPTPTITPTPTVIPPTAIQ